MSRMIHGSCLLVLLSALAGCTVPPDEYDSNWPQWRGPSGTGVASAGNPPVEWSE